MSDTDTNSDLTAAHVRWDLETLLEGKTVDELLDAADTWFSYDNASYTHAAVAAPMATLAVSSGSFTADWTVTVPAGQTVLVPHWHMQSDVSADALTDQLLSDFTADGATHSGL